MAIRLNRSFFTREEAIGGLEISDSSLRLAVLEIDRKHHEKGKKKKPEIRVQSLFEEPLQENSVSNGRIVHEAAFMESLKNLAKKAQGKVRYVIVSLPVDALYLKTFHFPESLRDKKLEEAMQLIIDFQLPKNAAEIFSGWQKIDGKKGEYLMGMMPKVVVEQYMKALEGSGFSTVAIEFHPLSLLRATDFPSKENVLVQSSGVTSTAIYLFSEGFLSFHRVFPQEILSGGSLEQEIKKIGYFAEAEGKPVTRVLNMGEVPLKKEFSEALVQQNMVAGNWSIALGAAVRGLLPRSEDDGISLMSLGSEKAYEYQKAAAFCRFVAHLTMGLSLFFVLIFAATWLFMGYLQQASLTTELGGMESVHGNIHVLEVKVQQFNALTAAGVESIKSSPRWSIALEEIKSRMVPDITLTSAAFTDPMAPITLMGISKNRSQINSFKESLEQAELFTEVLLPLANLEIRENIPFSITLRLRDPQAIFY